MAAIVALVPQVFSFLWDQKENISIEFARFKIFHTMVKRWFTNTPENASIRDAEMGQARMLVFWEQRLAILATPKTGSTAIEAALESLAAVAIQRPPALKHTTVAGFRRFVGPYLESVAGGPFTVVALMREPRDWLGSWYRYRSRSDIPDAAKSTSGLSFEDFVLGWCATPRPVFADVGSQARFLNGGDGRGADQVFRYENIDSFISFLEDRLDFQIFLPQLNVSPKATLDLSPETEAQLKRAAAEDFALYHSLP